MALNWEKGTPFMVRADHVRSLKTYPNPCFAVLAWAFADIQSEPPGLLLLLWSIWCTLEKKDYKYGWQLFAPLFHHRQFWWLVIWLSDSNNRLKLTTPSFTTMVGWGYCCFSTASYGSGKMDSKMADNFFFVNKLIFFICENVILLCRIYTFGSIYMHD